MAWWPVLSRKRKHKACERKYVSKKRLIWKIPCIGFGVILGIVLLLLVAVTVVLVTPGPRTAALHKCVKAVNARTDWDVDLGRLYLSPFHHSPKMLFHAYKRGEELPLRIEIDSLFVGHRGQDTLIYVHALRLQGKVKKVEDGVSVKDLTDRTIVVDQLLLEQTTFHSDTLLDGLGIDAIVKHLDVKSPGLNIAKGIYPLHGLKLADAYVNLALPDAPPGEATDTSAPPMAFDVPDGELRNVRFVLNPMGMDIRIGSLDTRVLADVGGNCYDVRELRIGDASFTLGSLSVPIDEILGDALVDLDSQLIQSKRLYARSDAFGAKAELKATTMNLETMRVDVSGKADYQGNTAALKGFYDIDDEAFDMLVNIEKVNLAPFLNDSPHVELAGQIHARGKGIDPNSPSMKCDLAMNLTDGIYDQINVSGLKLDASLANKTVDGTLHLPVNMSGRDLRLKAQTEHQFRVSDFLTPQRMNVDYHTQMKDVTAHVAGEDFDIDQLLLDFATDKATSLNLATEGFTMHAQSPMHVLRLVDEVQPLLGFVSDTTALRSIASLQDLTLLDTLKRLIPDLGADILLGKGSPVQSMIERMGLDIRQVALSLKSDARQSDLSLDASIPDIGSPDDSTALRLPAAEAALRLRLTEGKTTASLTAHTDIADGVMNMHDLSTQAALNLDLERGGRALNGTGYVALDSLTYNGMALGNRTADILISPSDLYQNAIRADVSLNDIPMELVRGFVPMEELDLGGFVRAKASVDGLPAKVDISADVLPLEISATYIPYDLKFSLGETPITMSHNEVKLNDFRVYGADSTYLALGGGLDIGKMQLDVDLAADHFSPAKLEQGGPIPVYGKLETDIHGRVSGPLDDILADVDVTILPTTDITYPIDKKNLAQVKPHGTVNVRYGTADGSLLLDGLIKVDDGLVRYSPSLYPMMPFQVDSSSNIRFQGPLGQTLLNISASQQVKADVQSEGEETRRVAFNTGVRVQGMLDSLGLNAIGFFLEAPEDEAVQHEIAAMDEDTREGVAAALLATGMYMGEGNVAAQNEGYALSSIINSRVNAALANSKVGKVIDIDISSGEKVHASGKTNDMNIVISKSLLNDRLRITAGSTISDNPEVNKTNGLFSHISADYQLAESGNTFLHVFSKRDYDNIFEGELYKSGIGVRTAKNWKTSQRTYSFTADADIAYRSNNSIGPNLTLNQTIRNLLGHEETLTVKGFGTYYWALRDRNQADRQNADTYKFGVDAALTFPYLHWWGDNKPDGDTRYRIGYKFENIAGGTRVHKFSGGISYIIRPSSFVTHVITPFSLSIVRANAESASVGQATDFVELVRFLAGNEFIPSIGYNFTYNDYRSKRPVNTMLDVDIKESGNLINAAYCAFGRKWDERDKTIFNLPLDQFVKLTAELRNKFNLTDQVCIATRLYAGANIPLGNSIDTPLSEAFYAGGPNSLRAAGPYAYGPGNFYGYNYNQNIFHSGDVKLEANLELRFPIVWKLFGAAFLDAGNVWRLYNSSELYSAEDYALYTEALGIKGELKDGFINNSELARQIALGTGAGLRLDLDGLVIRLDLGVAIHAPYQTYRYAKDGTPDLTQPITGYYNIPSFFDGLRLNFGIGYPF